MTVTVDIANPGVLNLLRELEGLKLLRLSVPAARGDAGEDWFEKGGECPLCAVYHEPNEETIAAFEEGDAILRGEIPAKRYESVDEFWKDLEI